ncbi:hypothetical protein K443DRAFT_359621 [Laccaria amethystina LaAM-08-1]|uniref:Uncharacterized protein n=1 Tax=Laccaria amethystina LaAM-08-1 TaxID=1095629 RepID=A0A0C9XJQ1_9AGAR|nr:hypothetical protein K443DRAFT_359621 [Laccaria amethystina LaAM-08-1]
MNKSKVYSPNNTYAIIRCLSNFSIPIRAASSIFSATIFNSKQRSPNRVNIFSLSTRGRPPRTGSKTSWNNVNGRYDICRRGRRFRFHLRMHGTVRR